MRPPSWCLCRSRERPMTPERCCAAPAASELDSRLLAAARSQLTPDFNGQFADLAAPLERLDRILARAVERVVASYGAEAAADPFRGSTSARGTPTHWSQNPRVAPILGVADGRGRLVDLIAELAAGGRRRAYGLTELRPRAHDDRARARESTSATNGSTRSSRTTSRGAGRVVDLALNLLSATAEAKLARREHFAADAPLAPRRPDRAGSGPERRASPRSWHFVKLDDTVVRYLLGSVGSIRGCASRRPARAGRLRGHRRYAATSGMRSRRLVADAQRRARASALLLRARHALKRETAHALAERGRRRAAHGRPRGARRRGRFRRLLRVAFREALLHDAVLYLEPLDPLRAEPRPCTAGSSMRWPTAPASRSSPARAATPPLAGPRGVVDVPFPIPSHDERATSGETGSRLRDRSPGARARAARRPVPADARSDRGCRGGRAQPLAACALLGASGRRTSSRRPAPGRTPHSTGSRGRSSRPTTGTRSSCRRTRSPSSGRSAPRSSSATACSTSGASRAAQSARQGRQRAVRRPVRHRQDDGGRDHRRASSGSTSTRSTSPASSASTSARPRRTSSASSPRPRTRTRSSSSTRRTRCSASAPRSATRTTATPTSRSPTCCSGWSSTTASRSSPPTCARTWTRRSCAGCSSSSSSRSRTRSTGADLAAALPRRGRAPTGHRLRPARPPVPDHRRQHQEHRPRRRLPRRERGGPIGTPAPAARHAPRVPEAGPGPHRRRARPLRRAGGAVTDVDVLRGLLYAHNRANANTSELCDASATLEALVDLLVDEGVDRAARAGGAAAGRRGSPARRVRRARHGRRDPGVRRQQVRLRRAARRSTARTGIPLCGAACCKLPLALSRGGRRGGRRPLGPRAART